MSHYIAQQPEIVMCTLSRKATVGQGRRRGKLQHMGGLHSMPAALVLGSTTLLRASSFAALASLARGVAWHRASVAPAPIAVMVFGRKHGSVILQKWLAGALR